MTDVRMRRLPSAAAWLLRNAGYAIYGGDTRALVVLIFHRVLSDRDPLLPGEPDAYDFAARMDLLAENLNVLPLSDASRRLRDGTLPDRAVCITFDDGYVNNLDIALPILQERGLPATVFVAPGFSEATGCMFNDLVLESVRVAPPHLDLRSDGLGAFELPDLAARIRAVDTIIGQLKYRHPAERMGLAAAVAERAGLSAPPRLMMDADQLRQLRAGGIEIGAHTLNHPILTRIGADAAKREITDSKRRLEEIIGDHVTAFAYPNGKPGEDYDESHVKIVAESGFDVAVTTAWGAATAGTDLLQIPRIGPWDATGARYLFRVISAYRQREVARA